MSNLEDVIKLVCTNPLSTFVLLPPTQQYSNNRSLIERANSSIQGFMTDILYENSFFPELALRKVRPMTDLEQRVYDQLTEISKEFDFKTVYGPSPKPSGEFSRAIREHADTLISFTSPTGRLNKSEPITRMHSIKHRGDTK